MLHKYKTDGKISKCEGCLPSLTVNNDYLKSKLVEFLVVTPNPEDEQIHKLAEINHIDKHEFEEVAYSLLGNLMSGGKSKGILPKNLDMEQLRMGIQVEYEHSSDIETSTKIAIDHLTEIPDYYTRLAKMEAEAKQEK